MLYENLFTVNRDIERFSRPKNTRMPVWVVVETIRHMKNT